MKHSRRHDDERHASDAELSEQHDRASSLFLSAVGLPLDERGDYLARECRHDRAMLDLVTSMLAHDERDDPFLSSPVDAKALPQLLSDVTSERDSSRDGASTVTDASAGSLRSLRQLGAFRVISLLAEGSTGAVFRAEQDVPRRDVAIKVIDPRLEPRLKKRLALESETLARMNHDGVVRVHASGTQETELGNVDFIAVELVNGLPLTEYVRVNRLPLLERVPLIIKVAEALQHVHDCGIIHRDVKPDNILVTESGQPKVADFGVARLSPEAADIRTDLEYETLVIDSNHVVGTLAYMSPEQLVSDENIDLRSDVYSLAVIAYELLSGRRPHDLRGKPLRDVVRVVTENEAPPLRRHAADVSGELATVVHCALSIDRRERYATMTAFANDLRSALDDRPISARPTPPWKRPLRSARRHPALASFVIATSLFAGVTIHQKDTATRNVNVHAGALTQAGDFLGRLMTETLSSFRPGQESTEERLARADQFIAAQGAMSPAVEGALRLNIAKLHSPQVGFDDAVRAHGETAVQKLQTAYGRADPLTLAAQVDVAALLLREGEGGDALQILDDVAPIIEATLPDKHEIAIRAELIRARVHINFRHYAGATAILEPTHERAARHLGDNHDLTRATVLALMVSAPSRESDRHWEELRNATIAAYGAHSEEMIGQIEQRSRQLLSEAEKLSDPALEAEALQLHIDFARGIEHERGRDRMESQIAWFRVANVMFRLGNREAAEALIREVEADAIVIAPDDARLRTVRRLVGDTLVERAAWQEALQYYELALESRPPLTSEGRRWRSSVLRRIAACHVAEGRTDEALVALEEALEHCTDLWTVQHARTQQILRNIVELLRTSGATSEAEKYDLLIDKERPRAAKLDMVRPRLSFVHGDVEQNDESEPRN